MNLCLKKNFIQNIFQQKKNFGKHDLYTYKNGIFCFVSIKNMLMSIFYSNYPSKFLERTKLDPVGAPFLSFCTTTLGMSQRLCVCIDFRISALEDENWTCDCGGDWRIGLSNQGTKRPKYTTSGGLYLKCTENNRHRKELLTTFDNIVKVMKWTFLKRQPVSLQ